MTAIPKVVILKRLHDAANEISDLRKIVLKDENPDFLLDAICEELEVEKSALKGESRTRYLADRRSIYAAFAFSRGFTKSDIARHLNKDHCTVRVMIERHQYFMEVDPSYKVLALKAEINLRTGIDDIIIAS